MVRHRLRFGGVVSGALLVAGSATLALLVASTPDWFRVTVDAVAGTTSGVLAVIVVGVCVLMLFGFPLAVCLLTAARPGNAALRRRVLVVDRHGIWVYGSALWLTPPALFRWPETPGGPGVGRIVAATIAPQWAAEPVAPDDRGDVDDIGPWLLPLDFIALTDGDGFPVVAAGPRATTMTPNVPLRRVTATVEQVVEQARRWHPGVEFLDLRTPPTRGPVGWGLRRRRVGRRWAI